MDYAKIDSRDAADISAPGAPLVEVALATYNGAAYLPEFLRSLDSQTYPNIALVCSDDASSDATVAIVRSITRPIEVLEANTKNLGAARNFTHAISQTKASYVALADQDDVWEMDKIERLMVAMSTIEREVGSNVPVLVFCDLRIVGSDLSTMRESFFANSFKSSAANRLKDFVISNHIPGCAMLLNRALIARAGTIPEDAFMHDWWFCMVAAVYGRIGYVDSPLVNYRQHGANDCGAPNDRGGWSSRMNTIWAAPISFVTNRVCHTRELAVIVNRHFRAFRRQFATDLPTTVKTEIDLMLSPLPWVRHRAFRDSYSGESDLKKFLLVSMLRR